MPQPAGIVLVLSLLFLGWSQPASAQEGQKRTGPFRLLVVQSYHPEFIWTRNVDLGIREALQKLPVSIDTLYMDAKRKPAPEQLRARAREILGRIEKEAPDVVVAVDDAAQEYLVEPFLKGRASPQVVFCGVNAPPRKYGFPASNVSGVHERWHYREGFALLRAVIPSARSVAVLGDASETARYVSDDILADENQVGPFPLRLAGVENIRTFQEWQRRVAHYQTRADALALTLYHTLVDERTGAVMPPEEVMKWTDAHNDKPTLGFFEAAQEHGLLCGVLESGQEQGYLAGQMARVLLTKGTAAGDLPVRVNTRGVILINLRTAERLKLRIPYEIIEAAGVLIQ